MPSKEWFVLTRQWLRDTKRATEINNGWGGLEHTFNEPDEFGIDSNWFNNARKLEELAMAEEISTKTGFRYYKSGRWDQRALTTLDLSDDFWVAYQFAQNNNCDLDPGNCRGNWLADQVRLKAAILREGVATKATAGSCKEVIIRYALNSNTTTPGVNTYEAVGEGTEPLASQPAWREIFGDGLEVTWDGVKRGHTTISSNDDTLRDRFSVRSASAYHSPFVMEQRDLFQQLEIARDITRMVGTRLPHLSFKKVFKAVKDYCTNDGFFAVDPCEAVREILIAHEDLYLYQTRRGQDIDFKCEAFMETGRILVGIAASLPIIQKKNIPKQLFDRRRQGLSPIWEEAIQLRLHWAAFRYASVPGEVVLIGQEMENVSVRLIVLVITLLLTGERVDRSLLNIH